MTDQELEKLRKLSIKDLRVKAQKDKDSIPAFILGRPFSIYITRLLLFTSMTPNFVTLISFSFMIIAAFFFFHGTWICLIIGAIFVESYYILDCVDGELARLKNMRSKIGHFFDEITGKLGNFLIIISLGWSIYHSTFHSDRLWILVILCLWGMIFGTYLNRVILSLQIEQNIIWKNIENKYAHAKKSKKTFYLSWISGGYEELFIIFFCVIDMPLLALYCIAILANLNWICYIVLIYIQEHKNPAKSNKK